MMTQPLDAAAPAPAIDLRFGQVGLMQLRIRTTDPGAILDELTGRVASAPLFFQRTGVCLDLTALGREPQLEEIRTVMDAVRRAGMLPVGLVGGSAGGGVVVGGAPAARAGAFPAADSGSADRAAGATGAAAAAGAGGACRGRHSGADPTPTRGARDSAWMRAAATSSSHQPWAPGPR